MAKLGKSYGRAHGGGREEPGPGALFFVESGGGHRGSRGGGRKERCMALLPARFCTLAGKGGKKKKSDEGSTVCEEMHPCHAFIARRKDLRCDGLCAFKAYGWLKHRRGKRKTTASHRTVTEVILGCGEDSRCTIGKEERRRREGKGSHSPDGRDRFHSSCYRVLVIPRKGGEEGGGRGGGLDKESPSGSSVQRLDEEEEKAKSLSRLFTVPGRERSRGGGKGGGHSCWWLIERFPTNRIFVEAERGGKGERSISSPGLFCGLRIGGEGIFEPMPRSIWC